MQISEFHDGSYHVHKITGNFKGRASGYFNSLGNLVDAEQIIIMGNPTRSVKRDGPIWNYIQEVGRMAYRQKELLCKKL